MSFNRKAASLSQDLSREFGDTVTITGEDVAQAINLMHGSDEAIELAIPYINTVANEIDISGKVAEALCKKLRRFFYKAVAKHNGNVEKVSDVGRFRYLVTNADDIKKIRKHYLGNSPRYFSDETGKPERKGILLDQHPDNKVTVKELEDFYHIPSDTGRVALHIVLDVKISGQQNVRIEIQVMLEDMVTTEELTRENYMSAQRIRRRAERKNRPLTVEEKESIENYDSSSRSRYKADIVEYGIIKLHRPDLQVKLHHQIKDRAIPTLVA